MSDKKLILLGKIVKVHGYGGAVLISTDSAVFGKLPGIKWVFIEIDNKPVPFPVSSVTEHSSGSIVLKFEGYDSSEKIAEFVGCRLYIVNDGSESSDNLPDHIILAGFTLLGPDNGVIGKIKKVMSLPMQYMLVLESPDYKELMIPLNDGWVIKTDREKKIIVMDIPNGILDINK